MLAASGLEPPAIVVLGEVVRLRAALDWLGALAGRVLVADPLGPQARSATSGETRVSAARGIVVAAAASHSGKTTVSLGLIAALRARGLKVAAAKCGPDYIDRRFLEAASGAAGDQPRSLGDVARDQVRAAGATGRRRGPRRRRRRDGPLRRRPRRRRLDRVARRAHRPARAARRRRAGTGADSARRSRKAARGWPRVFASPARSSTRSPRSGTPISSAKVFRAPRCRCSAWCGATRPSSLPSRHLGLVQAEEHADLASKIARAGELVAQGCDLDVIVELASQARRDACLLP